MKKRSIYILIFANWLILPSCEETSSLAVHTEAVVEAYLYADAPVENIQISSLIPFGAEFGDISPTNDLLVSLKWKEQSFMLSPTEGDSGYYHYTGNDLQIQHGETYQLSFAYNGKNILAETIVPSPPQGLFMPKDDITMTQIVFGGGIPGGGLGGGFQVPDPLEVFWDNSNGDYHYIVIENIERSPESIFVDLPFERNFNFITEPTSSDVFLIRPQILEQFGTHRVVLYRVNQEYVDLYENREQDSRNLTEPLTNIENGLGVFTAFNSDTLYFEVKKQ